MRFRNCFCTNSICGPSRAVMLTGKYSHINGFIRQRDAASTAASRPWPSCSSKAGYQTAMIGKWHLVSDPTGFDYWNILPGQGVYHNPVDDRDGPPTKKHAGYVTDIITDSVLEYLKNRRDPAKPFFLMYHHKAPHRPWQPDAKPRKTCTTTSTSPSRRRSTTTAPAAASRPRTQEMTVERHLTPHRREAGSRRRASTAPALQDDGSISATSRTICACIASVDDNVGRVLDYLDRSGLARNTIVIYTSDQGFFLGDHGWFDKRFMYEESLRMPLLIRWPGHIKPRLGCDDDGR